MQDFFGFGFISKGGQGLNEQNKLILSSSSCNKKCNLIKYNSYSFRQM